MKVRDVPIADIEVGDRLRQIDTAWVRALEAAIEENGFTDPILVTRGEEQPYRLVAGRHRLQAMSRLRHETIPAVIKEPAELDAKLAEIDDNLIRRNLSYFDWCTHIIERKAIYEARHPEAKHGGDKKSADFKEENQVAILATRFSTEAAERIGMSERSVQRAVGIVKRLAPDVRERIAGSPGAALADSQKELYALSKLGPAQQRPVANELLAGNAKTVAEAARLIAGAATPQLSPDEEAYRKLILAWSRAPAKARKRFLTIIKAEVTG